MSTSTGHELDPRDPVDLDASLTDEEREIRDTVRRFVAERVLPDIGERYEQATFDSSIATELGSMGVLGMHLDGYGCPGMSATSYGVVCAELEYGDSGVRSFASVQGSLAMKAIHAFGSEDQKHQWLPPMAAGEKIGCFGLTEPDAGSNPAQMRTTARRDGDDWVLDGTKMWITNGCLSDVAVVWARTDDGIRGFLVDTATEGFESRPMTHKLSLRASVTSELHLDGCRVPDSARLPEAAGLRAPLACLAEARFGIIWGTTGAARACYEAALDYATTREQFGKPIAGFQLTQRKLVEMAVDLGRAQLLALHLGRRKDERGLAAEEVSIGKLANGRTAIEIARTARGVLGASGISLEYPVIRHMTNLESVITYEGTEEIHTLAIGRALTGENAIT
ncbi:acyl-CoA dehydrogenase [Egibacter rhizosphaerae]|uniref:Acyl-CoA dehydrogenase n=1 Tax=Egibacter rhizosphaerae TaxID=1670831 RepID=A0A411YGV0_9ACTN|nr:acyl-CoA dehydrogenase family protein [Egibacter rhizosphaerae]QBI20379.1 acyl-CoA dehydrogenase [Egibacter rhizosphaerae]